MEFNILTLFVTIIFGLVFGSFLNVLIYRLPLSISLINPKRSVCTNCNYTIKWYENIPVVSYIFLRGKCTNCKEKISIIYPIVEILTSFVTVLLYLKLGFKSDFFITTLLFYLLIILSFIDFEYKAVPDYLLILVFISAYLVPSFSFITALEFAGAIVILELFITYYIQNIKSRIVKDESLKDQKAMGEGDIPIFAIIGGILGLKLGVLAIFLSAILAIIPSLLNIIVKKDVETPFIPFLSLSLFIVYINDIYFVELLNWMVK
ncbi:MAG: prepilin peptidase [Campylobacterota bacterium]|nr:prepilin peptidase [Campylobacterota bacterium]